MQAVKPAVIATASLMMLQGCAGLNELTDGEFSSFPATTVSQTQEFLPQRATTQSAVSEQVMYREPTMDSGRAGTSNGVIAESTEAVFVDPIDAPPPPRVTTPQPATAQIERPASRPMMLVPAPGDPAPVFEMAPAQQVAMPQTVINTPAPQRIQPPSFQVQVIEPEPIVAAIPVMNETIVISSVEPQRPLMGREFIPASIGQEGLMSESMSPGDIELTREQKNILERFSILERLTEEGLLTRQERDQRRAQNIGAILPYTSPAPARSLGREVPSGDAISARLASLRRSLEMRAITPRQHALERRIILDALLPIEPRVRATAEPPPSDVIEAAALIGQLERLRFSGVISDEEFEGEKSAIDGYLMTGMIPEMSDVGTVSSVSQTSVTASPAAAQSIGLHLASYRTQQAAEAGWRTISGKYQRQLTGLNSRISRVELGQGKGTFFRLLAVSVTDQQRAKSICDQLKRSNQYCDPLSLDG